MVLFTLHSRFASVVKGGSRALGAHICLGHIPALLAGRDPLNAKAARRAAAAAARRAAAAAAQQETDGGVAVELIMKGCPAASTAAAAGGGKGWDNNAWE